MATEGAYSIGTCVCVCVCVCACVFNTSSKISPLFLEVKIMVLESNPLLSNLGSAMRLRASE